MSFASSMQPSRLPRATYRLGKLLGITSKYMAVHAVELTRRGGYAPLFTAGRARDWAESLVRALGARVVVHGERPTGGALIVSNHRSYLDVAVIGHVIPVTFLAKASVRSWPLLGKAAAMGNTLFVSRKDAASRKQARQDVRDMLGKGISVVVFPEGTTCAPPDMLQFKSGIFAVAADAGVDVVPAAIEYDDPADAYVGGDTFVPHFIRTFGKKRVTARLWFGEPLRDMDADELRQRSQEWIREMLMAHAEKSRVRFSPS